MRKELEGLAMFVHGALGSLHLLGAVFNLRRKNWKDATIHTVVLTYDAHSAWKHYQRIKDVEKWRRQKTSSNST